MRSDYSELKEKYPEAAIFFQLGVYPNKTSGAHLVCDCFICGRKNKFYLNPIKKTWDCKHCGAKGGFNNFLTEIETAHVKACNSAKLLQLAKLKNLPLEAFKKHTFGWDAVNKQHTLFIKHKKKTTNIRIFNSKGKGLNTTGFGVVPFGLDRIKSAELIYIVEGESDKLALETILTNAGTKKEIVVCITGAQTFKETWITHFINKNVVVCYDNDLAGKKGNLKVRDNLAGKTDSLRFLVWSDEAPEKFDIKDFYNKYKDTKKPKVLLRKLKGMFETEPVEVEGYESTPLVELVKYDGEFVPPHEVEKAYKKWLHMPNTEMLDVIFGTAIANRLSGQPLWLFLIGASGSGKTEYVESIAEAANVTSESHVTGKSLISGAHGSAGSDPSLIPKLDGKVLIIKDFTVTINSNPLEVEETFGILRDIYDGKIERSYGNGAVRKYKSKFGIIAACTPIIDKFTKDNTALGERFLKYRLPLPNNSRERLEYIARALNNSADQTQMREELAEIGTKVLAYDYPEIRDIESGISHKIMALAQFVSMGRASVMRDKFRRDQIIHKPFQELGTRLAQQFSKQLRGISMYRGLQQPTNAEYEIVKKIGLSSIPDQIESVIRFICDQDIDNIYTLKELVEVLKIAHQEVNYILEDMVALELLDVENTSNNIIDKKFSWSLSEDAKYLIKMGDLYEA